MEQVVRILFVEDLPADVRRAEHQLNTAGVLFKSLTAGTEAGFRQALVEYQPDLVISNCALLEFDGMRALQISLEHDAPTPTIILVNPTDEETAVSYIQAGAAACVPKNDLGRLPRAVRRAVRQKQERDAREYADQALCEREQRFRRLVENAQDIVFRVRLRPRIGFDYISPAVSAVVGHPPEAFYADAALIDQIVHPDDVRVLNLMVTGAIPADEEVIVRLIRPDKSIAWIEERHVLIKNIRGELTAIEGIARDITDRVQAEQRVRQQEEELAAIYENTPYIMMLLDSDRRVRKANGPAMTFSGRPAGGLLGLRGGEALRCLHSLEHPNGCGYGPHCHQCVARRTILNTLETGVSHHQVEGCLPIEVNGRRTDVAFLISTRCLNVGRQPMVLVTLVDISDRKRTEEALRRSETEKSLILNSTAELFGYYDLDLSVRWANRAAGESVGESAEALVGRHCYEIWQSQSQPCTGCPILIARETGLPQQAEMVTPDGRVWHLRGYPVRSEDGAVVGLVEFGQDITEQRRSEAEVRERDARISSIFRAAPVGIGIVVDRIIQEANDALCHITGYTREELLGQDARVLYPTKRDYEYVGQVKYDQIAERGIGSIETRWRRKDGSIIQILLSSSPLDPTDLSKGVLFTALDITETKQAEKALRDSEARYRRLVETAHEGIWSMDAGFCTTFVNRRMGEMLGYRPEEMLGRPVTDFMPPEEVQDHTERMARRVLGDGDQYERRFVRKDGTIVTHLVSATSLADDRGSFAGSVALFTDITERKRDEAEREWLIARMQEQARRVQQIVDTVPTGMLLLSPEARIIVANPVAERDLTALAGAAVGDILTHLGSRSIDEIIASPPKGLWHEINLDERTFEVIARPIAGQPGPEGWVLVINETTRERQVRDQLEQQGRLASLGQLAAGIAHDFNNILAIILLYTQMALRNSDVPLSTRDQLSIVAEQSKRAANLIQQILDFSRRAMLRRQPVDLCRVLRDQVDLLRRTIPENIQIELVCGSEECTVDADVGRMQQMITNLAVNARDAMVGGGKLFIGLDRLEVEDHEPPLPASMGAGDWVRLVVSDTGTGIQPNDLPRIFEPFFTTKPPGEGSGLGLAQVYGIVGQHEGHIDVQTQVGLGATFTVYLPALPSHAVLAQVDETASDTRGSGETVLVVEDQVAVRRALRASLEQLGYKVQEADDGIGALTVLDSNRGHIQLILSDVIMPGMGGMALLDALRERGEDLPFVLMSGHPMEGELDALRARGLSGWISKPPALDELAKVIASVLQADVEPR